MQILKEGETPWFLTVKNVCKHCGTVYVLKPDDVFDVSSVYMFVDSKCPTCKQTVFTDKPEPKVWWLWKGWI